MDILFENRYVRDRDMAKEFYGYYLFRRKILKKRYENSHVNVWNDEK